MPDLSEKIRLAIKENKDLFYNTSGSKTAYQLGVKHISSAEYLGFAESLPNKNIRAKKVFFLVDFENKTINMVQKETILTPVALGH